MGFFDSFFDFFKAKKSAPRNFDDLDDRPRYETPTNNIVGGTKGNKATDIADFLNLYKIHPWAFACARDVAQSAAGVEYQLLRENKEIKKKELIWQVIDRPNPHDTYFDFMEATFTFLELSGNNFWELVRNKDGDLVGMYVLPPHKMEILPHKKLKVAGYIYRPSANEQILYDASEIIHIKYLDPMDEYWGMPANQAAKNGFILDLYATTWNKTFFQQGAEPGGTLETDQSISPNAYERLKQSWLKRHQGAKNWHIPAILEEGLKYKPITAKHSDMEYTNMRNMTKEEIYEVNGVPIKWRTDANQKKVFYYSNIMPKLKKIEKVFNAAMADPEKPGVVDKDNVNIKFLTRSIEAMVEDEAIKADIANQNTTHGIMTINEVRERYYGLDPVEWGDDWWAPVGLMPTKSGVHPTNPGNEPGRTIDSAEDAGTAHPNQTPKLDQPSRLDQVRTNKRHPELSLHVQKRELMDLSDLETAEPDWSNKKEVYLWKRWITFQKIAGPDEKRLVKVFHQYFSDQFEAVKQELKTRYSRFTKAAEHKIKKDEVDPALLLDWDKQNKKLKGIYEKEGKKILEKYGNITLSDLEIPISFDLDNARMRSWMQKYTGERVTAINDHTQQLIRDSLNKSVDEGGDFEDAIEQLGQVFGVEQGGISDFRARRIARTELITLSNESKLEAAKQTGVVEKKMWVSELLPTTRDNPKGENHVELHGQIVGIDEKFHAKSRNGVDEMDGPGDISASAENVVNCLCVLDFPPEDEEYRDLFEEATNT